MVVPLPYDDALCASLALIVFNCSCVCKACIVTTNYLDFLKVIGHLSFRKVLFPKFNSYKPKLNETVTGTKNRS